MNKISKHKIAFSVILFLISLLLVYILLKTVGQPNAMLSSIVLICLIVLFFGIILKMLIPNWDIFKRFLPRNIGPYATKIKFLKRHHNIKISSVFRFQNLLRVVVEVIIAMMPIIFTVPFSNTQPISYYETLNGHQVGSWWYMGLIMILFIFTLNILVRYLRGGDLLFAFQSKLFVLIFVAIFSLFVNSMLQHGVFIHIDYFSSYQFFFSSDMSVSIMIGMVFTLPLEFIASDDKILVKKIE